jgi:hypothetical protein
MPQLQSDSRILRSAESSTYKTPIGRRRALETSSGAMLRAPIEGEDQTNGADREVAKAKTQ